MPEDKVTSILEHIHQGCGVLKTARLVKVHPETVSRSGRAAGDHCRAAHDELVAHSPETRELEMDENWSFVAKTEKNCDQDDPETSSGGTAGTTWRSTRSTAWSCRWSRGSGRRNRSRSWSPMSRSGWMAGCRSGSRPTSLRPMRGAILEAFGTEVVPPRTGKPGRPRKAFKVAPAELHDATLHTARKKGRVVDVVRRVSFGTAASVEAAWADSEVSRTVNTSFVERHNGTDRNRKCAEGSDDVLLLEGLVSSSGRHLLHDVQ